MTPKQIDKLVPGCYPIEHHPGLRLEVRAKRKSWTLRRRDPEGKLKQVIVGHYPAMSLVAAVQACEAIRAAGWGETERVPTTVDDVVDAYIRVLRTRRKDPAHIIALLWRHTRAIGRANATELDRRAAYAHFAGLTDRPAVAKTLKHLLVAAWHYGMDAGLLPDGANIWERVAVQPGKPRQRVLDDTELKTLLAWLPESKLSQSVQDALLLTLYTAARSGECIGIAWADLDLPKGEWHLRGEDTKTGVGRVVPLNALAVELLAVRKAKAAEGELWVFPAVNRDGAMKQHILVNALCAQRETCPVQGWTAHDLRRSARTHLAKLGCPADIGERLVGHSIGGVRAVYDLYSYGPEQKEWAERWGQHLRSLTAGEPNRLT